MFYIFFLSFFLFLPHNNWTLLMHLWQYVCAVCVHIINGLLRWLAFTFLLCVSLYILSVCVSASYSSNIMVCVCVFECLMFKIIHNSNFRNTIIIIYACRWGVSSSMNMVTYIADIIVVASYANLPYWMYISTDEELKHRKNMVSLIQNCGPFVQ